MKQHAVSTRVPVDHPCLAGHFPGNPVVPAVLLLECVTAALGEAVARPIRLSGVPAAKFLAPVLPGQDFTVELQLEPDGGVARFRCTEGARELAVGRVEFCDAP
jgi:3-hydroxyacyl-[acyl-carrier-protein] dehydratase